MSGAVFPSCWLFGLRHPSTGVCSQLVAARSWCQSGKDVPLSSCHWYSCPYSETQPASAYPGDPLRPTCRSGTGSYELTALPQVPVHMKPCVYPSKSSQSCGASALKLFWPSEPNVPGAPPPNARPTGWGACCGVQNSLSCGRTSVM